MASVVSLSSGVVSEKREWHGVLLQPLDVLLFRDGRPFGATSRVLSQYPWPQTVAGALRTALLAETGFSFERLREVRSGDIVERLRLAGADEEILQARFRGPWLAKRFSNNDKTAVAKPLFPCPVNFKTSRADRNAWVCSRPVDTFVQPVPGWDNADGLWPMKFAAEPDPKFDPKWLTLDALRRVLKWMGEGQDAKLCLELDQDEAIDLEALQRVDHRIGIGIDPTKLTTIEGELYGIGFMSLPSDMRIYVEIQTSDRIANLLHSLPLSIGGEGKYALAEKCHACQFPVFDPTRKRSLWYMATPTFLKGRSIHNRPLPPMSVGVVRGAASGPGMAVSGWDVALRGPRKTEFAVPAGAIYFLEGAGSEASFIESDMAKARRQEGWGFAIQENWS